MMRVFGFPASRRGFVEVCFQQVYGTMFCYATLISEKILSGIICLDLNKILPGAKSLSQGSTASMEREFATELESKARFSSAVLSKGSQEQRNKGMGCAMKFVFLKKSPTLCWKLFLHGWDGVAATVFAPNTWKSKAISASHPQCTLSHLKPAGCTLLEAREDKRVFGNPTLLGSFRQ